MRRLVRAAPGSVPENRAANAAQARGMSQQATVAAAQKKSAAEAARQFGG